jgi:hypothetical protein
VDFREVQQRIAEMSDDDIETILHPFNEDLADFDISDIRRRAATVDPITMREVQTNDYVFGNPMGRVNELAFDLLAFVEHPEYRVQALAAQTEPVERTVTFDGLELEPPF